ncbi:hypothetical protein HUK80_05295 [Flavobacterium sp. MAH-1]|uniref:Ig-like domain-containing protein n=1 Tax=Flavobacterium agri TaxID=2743471 RepID=A0A7Y8Y0T2_9FLAO|nr:hypothetical protein [Flavobacterium agri]NUY80301.1 hypothetical protein [Flavobacterium agri]NYA70326.1 hypothetical protein [Flavobacterium agri]
MKTNYFSDVTTPNFTRSLIYTLLFFFASASMWAQCPTPPGNPNNYSTGFWTGYVYSGLDANNPPQNTFTTTVYRGYITLAEQFDSDLVNAAPTAATVCGSYPDSFSVRYRMRQTFTPGYYSVTIGGDDGVRLSIDGGATWAMSDWNYHSYQTTTATLYLSGTLDMVFESYDQGGQYHVSFAYSACTDPSTAPTAISGTTDICGASSTTLTATGGYAAAGSTYQWGTGNVVGNNIIAGQTTASITVNPAATTTYWVRRQNPAPCAMTTSGVTQQVTVTPTSTAPTSITGTTSICAGSSTTLTANGGVLAAGSVYEWGTGSVVGDNTIAGQTGVSITVSPTATTTYWVRRINGGNCGRTAGVTATVTVTPVPGDQVSYATNSWIGYVYSGIDAANPPATPFTTTVYRGTIAEPEIFDYNLGTAAISGANICGTYAGNFAIRFKMSKNWTAGYYTFTVGGDDGYRFSMDGGATWTLSNWADHGYATSSTANLYLSGSKDFVIEFYERGGDTRVTFNYTACTDISTAPTSISGNNAICNGSSTTLTATGGYAGAYATYQWGTGATVGNNIITGQTAASITVNPNLNTTYWVRRIDGTPCNLTTSGVTQTVTVTIPSTAPTSITGTTTTCGGSTTLTANGGTLVAGGAYEWGTGTVGSNIIAGATGVSITVTPTATTTYWVRRTSPSPCNTPTNAATVTVTVNASSTAPTSISGSPSLCSISGVTLSADGGTAAAGATYQWGTGAVVGNNVIVGTNQTLYVNPAATTVYWVRRYDASCATYTTGVTATVYKGSTGPWSIAGAGTICANTSTVLTANGGTPGTGSMYQWGTGNTAGQNIITGQTAATITVTPTATTTYWVRLVDQGPCPGTTAVFYTLNTYVAPTAPTSITGTNVLCYGTGGTTLYSNGATLGSNGQYQWGTGATVGNNIIAGAASNNYYINPNATTTYWVRAYDATCGTYTAGVTYTVTVSTASTNPTTITATNNTVCSGASTTLTASGGTIGTGATYNWGTGWTVGQNVIAGQTAASITVSPTAQTVYWVRRIDPTPCNTQTGGPTITINVTTLSTAPTALSATSPICSGTQTTLTATGATLGSGGQYQFGTGNTAGANILSTQNGNTYNVTPAATTTYWVRTVDASCSGTSTAVYFTITVHTASTAPTAVTGTNTICSGQSTTLTATGGTLGTAGSYQWGTGTVGNNIIAGENGVSITVSPTATTTYWVRRLDIAPCNTTTGGQTRTVTVSAAATAPTAITGAPASSVCAGSSYTLTATGGSGATYQWGTGTVGSNIITGQTGNTITVTPTATTTYWVRRVQAAPCTGYTAEATTTVDITAAPGNPSTFGANQWNVYGYSTGDITLATAVYAGYYVSTDLSFDTQTGTNSWNNNLSVSSSAGWNGCSVPVDNFTFIYKRRGFPCGTYTLALANWDDQVRVYVDGNLVFSCDNWSGGGGCNNGAITGSFNLTNTSQIEVRVRENGGGANLKMNFTKTDVASTAPTTITGGGATCNGASVTLTASGGTMGTNGSFQWGTGTVGQNIIAGEASASITVSPTATTTYWVRRRDSLCGLTTVGVTSTVTVSGGTNAGTLVSPSTVICRNSMPQNITLTGYTGTIVKWQYASNSTFTSGVTDIANTTDVLTSAQMGSIPSTRYFRAAVQSGICPVAYTDPVVITILPAITYNGTWSGTPTALTPIIVSANLNLTSNITACTCQVTNNATITVQSNANLIVEREIIVDEGSNIIVESNGSIVQIEDDAANIGVSTVKRNSAPMKNYDFTYWSSPVQNFTLYNLSPLTRFDKYYSFNPVTNNWVIHMNGAQVMQPGRGYIVRAPLDWSVTNATQGVYHSSFVGVPNTGIIAAPIAKGAGTFNLVGNPYPSAIDIDLFLTDPANENLVNGTIYLWTHNTAISASIPGNAQYNYTADDYAKYNLTGGVKTANPAITGGVEPTGKVASGQSFFIDTNPALANGSYTATFRNSMRVTSQNDQFFKVANNASAATVQTVGLEKHRAWINIHNADGAYDEMLLGYIQNATNGLDRLFDGPIFNGGNFISIYSFVNNGKMSIQGRALPFDVADVVPIGFKTSVPGTFTISLEHFDGLFQNQNVYLLDKTDMSYHNLSEADYSFTSATGTFDSRFEIHYQTPSLGIGDHTPNENSVYIVKSDKHIEVSSGNYNMTDIQIFDLTGKKVYEKSGINATLFSTKDLNIASQVLIVKVTLDNDVVITKKVIMY